MWRFLGEHETGHPAGTCYYHSSRMITTFWHVFDQVLVPPGLLDRFPEESVQVVTRVGDQSLVRGPEFLAKAAPQTTYPLLSASTFEEESVWQVKFPTCGGMISASQKPGP